MWQIIRYNLYIGKTSLNWGNTIYLTWQNSHLLQIRWYCQAHLTNLRIRRRLVKCVAHLTNWSNARHLTKAQRLVNCTRVWPNARAFGQSYQQWPNANAIRQMRENLANCAAHLAKYFQNKTTYARPLFIMRNLTENVYQVVAVIMLYSSRLCTEVVIYSLDDIVLDSWNGNILD